MDQSLFTIKNIKIFAVETFKIKHSISPETVSDIFLAETGYYYNFRQQNDFLLPSTQTLYHKNEN